MNKTGCAWALAAALLFPGAAWAGGSIVTLEAAKDTRSILRMGTPAPCDGDNCSDVAMTKPEAESGDAVKVDSAASAAGDAATTAPEPPVSMGEITASVTPDANDGADEDTMNDAAPEPFSDMKLRPGF